MSTRRAGSAFTLVFVATLIVGTPAAMAAGGIDAVSPPNAYTVGNALARSTGRLQVVWASDCPLPSGRCATDGGPYIGVFWQRSKPLRQCARGSRARSPKPLTDRGAT